VFRLAASRPELLGLVREVTRPGSPGAELASDSIGRALTPAIEQARGFLAREMQAGRLRESDPTMLMMSLYATVVGVATEAEVQSAMGMEPSLRMAVARRQELTRFLRAALTP
jgi:MOSC domain-containing protein YiiM